MAAPLSALIPMDGFIRVRQQVDSSRFVRGQL
jgi:hypothetical protein